ncbi:MAG: hypothetical protein ACK4HQ_00965 [Brevinematales bacterium]
MAIFQQQRTFAGHKTQGYYLVSANHGQMKRFTHIHTNQSNSSQTASTKTFVSSPLPSSKNPLKNKPCPCEKRVYFTQAEI